MNIVLTDDVEEFVKAKLATGHYASATDVVREALRILDRHEKAADERTSYLRRAYAEGKASGVADDIDLAGLKAEGRTLLEKSGK